MLLKCQGDQRSFYKRDGAKMVSYLTALFLYLLTQTSCSALYHNEYDKGDLSPYRYGLAKAKNGIERYHVILETHRAAIAAGVSVDYTGIDTLRLEIPAKPISIPLTHNNDFKGCVFIIKNKSKSCWLFNANSQEHPIRVIKSLIDSGNFKTSELLRRGRYLLVIEDEKPWILNRRGHSYGHTRKDILLIENGIAKNSVTMPYDNEMSSPKCSYIQLNDEPFIIKNLTIERDTACTYVTHTANISGFDNVRISNVKVHTPFTTLDSDRGIKIINCTNVNLMNVHIDGTYSRKDHYGYGINLENIWNFKATNLFGKAEWGIFGNNNVNTVMIKDSKINRFDIHCYGSNVSFDNVDFFDGYNQFAGVYGTISFKRCNFTNFVPILNDGSYNAYVKHEVLFNDCVFDVEPSKNFFFKFSRLNGERNIRPELSEKCMPNVSLKNVTVNMKAGAKDFFLFNCNSSGRKVSSIHYINNISVDGLTLFPDDATPIQQVALSNIEINTLSPVECCFSNVDVVQSMNNKKRSSTNGYASLKTNMKVVGGKVIFKNVRNLNQ